MENDDYLLRLSCYIHRNPLRAGRVERLVDYPWSSYPFYGYKKKSPQWLNTGTILDFLSGDDPHKAYRKKMRDSDKEKRDLLIYFLFKTERFSNQKIGDLFELTYSSISKSVKAINDKIGVEQRLKDQYQELNSNFKV